MGDVLSFPRPGRYHGAYDVLNDAILCVIREHGDKAAVTALKLHITCIQLSGEFEETGKALHALEEVQRKSRDTCGNDCGND